MTGQATQRVSRRAALGRLGRAALGAVLVLAAGVAAGDALAAGRKSSRLTATRYFTMAPFTLPLIDDGVITEQMTLVIALELTDDQEREEVTRLVPRIRDALYRELYAMVTFRRKGSPMPDVDRFKVRLYRVVRDIVTEKRVKALLVQQAFKRPVR